MPLRRTIFLPESYYHIYNRGSEKRTIFLDHRDYTKFLDRTKENAEKYAIEVLCYCLMPNHYHFLLKQTSKASIASFMNALQLGHAKYFNTKYKRVGPLFQGRFKAKPVESESYLLQLSGYIHKNPITKLIDSKNAKDSRNRLLQKLREFPYSSYHEYLDTESRTVAKPNEILTYFSKTNPLPTYQAFVEDFISDIEKLAPILADLGEK